MTTVTPVVPTAPRQLRVLTLRTLHDRWRGTVGWGLGLMAMAVLQLSVYPSVAKSAETMQAFVDEWPEAFRETFGLESYATGAGFLNAELMSMMVPLVLIAVATTAGAAATAGEEDRGTADLLFSLPVSRIRVLAAKTLSMVIAVAVVAVATYVTIVLGSPIADLNVGAGKVAAALTMVGLLAILFGVVTLLLGCATGRRALALAVGVGLALAAFLLNALAPMADWLEPWQNASPFQWALGDNPLVNGMDRPMAGLLVGLSIVLWVVSAIALHRHDIGGR